MPGAGRVNPSLRILLTSVVRLSPRRIAAPRGPPKTQFVSRRVFNRIHLGGIFLPSRRNRGPERNNCGSHLVLLQKRNTTGDANIA
jgi:hypothetical protein